MIRQLSRSIREYKMASLATPLLVSGEVVMECLIPFLIAELVNEVKSGCDMNRMLRYGLLLVLMAALSLAFGALAGCTCARASCGLARNLRKDLFYSIQDYSFENIDHFYHLLAGDPHDHRCDQRAERLHDDHPHGHPRRL